MPLKTGCPSSFPSAWRVLPPTTPPHPAPPLPTCPPQLAKLVLGGMRARRRGAVINIGSGSSSVIPTCPLLSVYAATKAYVDFFSQSLAEEYRRYGIVVQNQAPMFVATKMSKIRWGWGGQGGGLA